MLPIAEKVATLVAKFKNWSVINLLNVFFVMYRYKIPIEIIHAVTVKKPKRVLKKITMSIYIILPKKKDRRTLPPIYKFNKS